MNGYPKSTSEHSGTTVTTTLDGRYSDTDLRTLHSLDHFFSWASQPEILEYVLRTRTAVGNTREYFGQAPRKPIRVYVTTDSVSKKLIPFRLLTPFDSTYASKSRYLLDKKFHKKRPYKEVFLDSTLRDADKIFRCLRCDSFELEVGRQARTKTAFDLSVLVCGETGVSELEGEFRIADVDDDVRHSFKSGTGIYLAINGMPTGILIHRWTDGFNKRFLCYVDVGMEANAELDKGRKGISEHTRNLIVNAVEDALNRKGIGNKYSIRQAARRMKDTQRRGYAGTDTKKHLDQWDEEPDQIDGFSIRKAPLDENGVIILFGELIGRGDIQGIEIRYISQDATYDFAFTARVVDERLDESDYSLSRGFVDGLDYDIEEEGWTLRGARGVDFHTGEFKIAAEDIVSRDGQPLSDLDLLVVWDFDEDKVVKRGGTIRELTADQRRYEGVTHLLDDANGECSVICLKHVLSNLGAID